VLVVPVVSGDHKMLATRSPQPMSPHSPFPTPHSHSPRPSHHCVLQAARWITRRCQPASGALGFFFRQRQEVGVCAFGPRPCRTFVGLLLVAVCSRQPGRGLPGRGVAAGFSARAPHTRPPRLERTLPPSLCRAPRLPGIEGELPLDRPPSRRGQALSTPVAASSMTRASTWCGVGTIQSSRHPGCAPPPAG